MPRPMNSGGTGVQAWFSSLLITSATVFHKSGKFSVNGPVASKDLKVGVSLYFRRKTLCVTLISIGTLHTSTVWVGA